VDVVRDAVAGVSEAATGAVSTVVGAAKPKLRGWIHAVNFPLVVLGTVLLVIAAPPVAGKVACAIFGVSACLLYGTSAVYHLGHWSPRVTAILRRADHSNIFLIIAGSYTAFAVLMLPKDMATILLWIVWPGAMLGLLARVLWLGAPRWLYVPIYLALGWVAVGYMPQFWTYGSPTIMWLIAGGGLAYTVGAVVYGLKKPNPSPRYFGFHEIFHVLTVIAFWCHYVAIWIAATGS
jgi:hemolysin III